MAAADQALSYLLQIPTVSLSALLILGAASRLSNGRFAPRAFYRYQTERLPNDKSIAARTLPIIDTFLGICLLYGGDAKRWASVFVLLGTILGLAVQLRKGGDAAPDVLLAGLALANLVFAWLFPVFTSETHHDYHLPIQNRS